MWRKFKEGLLEEITRKRWKSYSEFMFWGCFSYDRKGPCHIWKPESAAEKQAAKEEIDKWNNAAEPIYREIWERDHPEETWHWNPDYGKRERRAKKGGINWFRYGDVVLDKKLLPFAFHCQKTRPETIVQEDGAPSHKHKVQQRRFDFWNVMKLLWPGNSPDLNAIEPAWPYMKRRTTCQGAKSIGKHMRKQWIDE